MTDSLYTQHETKLHQTTSTTIFDGLVFKDHGILLRRIFRMQFVQHCNTLLVNNIVSTEDLESSNLFSSNQVAIGSTKPNQRM